MKLQQRLALTLCWCKVTARFVRMGLNHIFI